MYIYATLYALSVIIVNTTHIAQLIHTHHQKKELIFLFYILFYLTLFICICIHCFLQFV